MRGDLAFIAGCISIVGALPYIFDTVKGKTHPNMVTWLTWTLFNGINAAAAWSAGATQTAVFSTAGATATGAILIAGLWFGIKRYTRFDIFCQTAALCGVALWGITSQPSIAVAINVAADFAGWLPTYRHAWKAPFAETWQTFALSGLSAAVVLVSIEHYTFIALAFPIYILIANLAIVRTILARRKELAAPRKKAKHA
jgi:hypothetical protein